MWIQNLMTDVLILNSILRLGMFTLFVIGFTRIQFSATDVPIEKCNGRWPEGSKLLITLSLTCSSGYGGRLASLVQVTTGSSPLADRHVMTRHM
jgi:hypothetical protein